MHLTTVKLDSLKPHPLNYNRHDDTQVGELAASLAQFDQYKNIVVWNGYIIAGHGLVEAARRNGRTDLVVNDRSDLSEADALALMVADNETARKAQADAQALLDLVERARRAGVETPGVTDEDLAIIQKEVEAGKPLGQASEGIDGLKPRGRVQIKPVLYVDQVDVFESALKAAGERNRGDAIVAVCQYYLDHHGEPTLKG